MAAVNLPERRIKTCRDRVRQKEWFPMPWDGTRRTVVFETVDEDFKMNSERTTRIIEARRRRLDEYRVFYYGSPEQLHNKKVQLCSDLKHQLESDQQRKIPYYTTTDEGKRLARQIQASIKEDNDQYIRKCEFLRHNIRDGNKTLIEVKAEQRKRNLIQSKREERDMLKHNPINWSKTLK